MSRVTMEPGYIEDVVEPTERELDQAVSIVIPAFDEFPHVGDEVRRIREVMEATGWRFEIIVVDDGSSDQTAEAAAAAGAHVLRHRQNRGYGAAIKRGVENARYDWILITDADGTYPTGELPRLLETASGNVMVVGARRGGTVKVPLARRPAKCFLGLLASYLAGQRLPDINSGLRLIRKDLILRYLHVLPSGFSFTTTITLAAACNHHEVEYVTVDYNTRKGRSKIRPWHAYEFMLLILRTIVFFNPLKVFIPLGAVLGLTGLGKFIYDVTQHDISDTAVLGVVGALIIWAVGLLADQNARVGTRR